MKKGILSVLFGIIWIVGFIWLTAIGIAFLIEAGVFHYIGKGKEGRTSLENILTFRFGADLVLLIVMSGAFYIVCVRLGAIILECISELESTMWKNIAKRRRERKKRKGTFNYNQFRHEPD